MNRNHKVQHEFLFSFFSPDFLDWISFYLTGTCQVLLMIHTVHLIFLIYLLWICKYSCLLFSRSSMFSMIFITLFVQPHRQAKYFCSKNCFCHRYSSSAFATASKIEFAHEIVEFGFTGIDWIAWSHKATISTIWTSSFQYTGRFIRLTRSQHATVKQQSITL